MASTVEQVAADALNLPSAGRAFLVEKLLGSLSGEVDSAVTRGHLTEVRNRRAAVQSGQSTLIEGDEAVRRARAALRQ